MTSLADAHHQSKVDIPGSAKCNLAVEVVLPALTWHIDVKRLNQVQGKVLSPWSLWSKTYTKTQDQVAISI